MAASTALENLPVEFRGIASGVIQQGYAAGYFIAAILNLFLVPKVKVGWRVLFYTAAGISTFSATLRALLPESEVFLRAKAAEKEKGGASKDKTKTFFKEIKEMLKTHWLLCIYAVLLMTGEFLFIHMGCFFISIHDINNDILQVLISFLMDLKYISFDSFERSIR